MRITEAAQRLGTSPRMLRYRDMLGLLPPVRQASPARPGPVREAASARPGPVHETVSARPGPVHETVSADPGPVRETASADPGPVRGAVPDLRGAVPDRGGRAQGPPRGHRRFGDDDLAAVAHALRIEQRYDISPAALAFGLKVLTEPGVRAEVAELGRRIGRITPPPARALDFEQQRALRLLRLPPGGTPRTRRD